MSGPGTGRDELDRQIAEFGNARPTVISSADGAVILVRTAFRAFEGDVAASPYVKLGLNLGGGGWMRQELNGEVSESRWRKGALSVTLGTPAFVVSPPVDMLGLAIDLDAWRQTGRTGVRRADLTQAAAGVHSDAFVSAIMTALWRSAELHGASTAFFEHGVSQILERLAAPGARKTPVRSRTLSRRVLTEVRDYLEAHLSSDVSVAQMASVAKMDVSTFAKRFAQTTGHTPFAYLTRRRMEHAKTLLAARASITEVALAVGYLNPGKFSAAFRRSVGCSPSVWCRAARGR